MDAPGFFRRMTRSMNFCMPMPSGRSSISSSSHAQRFMLPMLLSVRPNAVSAFVTIAIAALYVCMASVWGAISTCDCDQVLIASSSLMLIG